MSAVVACRSHPARDAIGVCVVCRAQVCGECSTKLDGVNHCVDCLASRAAAVAPAAREHDPAPRGRLAAAITLGLAASLWWALLEAGLPR